MRRLFRHLFAVCAFSSLLLCLATCALWVRSLRTGDMLTWAGERAIVVRSDPGLITVNVSLAEPDQQLGFRYDSWTHSSDWSLWRWMGPRWWDRMGFGHYVGGSRTGQRVDQYVFPDYAVVVATAVLPAFACVRWFHSRRRTRIGLCPKCGYDLRASPDRCPECGAPAA
jgi:hypothetical protein